ncbi:MAG: hypothetical protein HQ567_18985, partial [Candidatus Nealsonbacteria bacterium]|nr:hypothetical protein [Candidatus Nealsonbacteria bacterium]
AYAVALHGALNVVDTDTTFNNTTTVTLGDEDTDRTTFTGGLDTTNCTTTNIAGIVATENDSTLSLGATNLTTDATLISDEVDFAGVVDGGGFALTIEPDEVTDAIEIGNGAAGGNDVLVIDTVEIGRLAVDTFSQITIGRTDGTHQITVGTSSFADPLRIFAPNAGGKITVNGQLDTLGSLAGSPATIDVNGSAVLNVDVVTAGAAVTFSSDVEVGNGRAVTVNTASGIAAGANVTFGGTVDGQAPAGIETLSVNVGSGGNVQFQDAVGATAPLDLTITNSNSTTFSGNTNVGTLTTFAQAYSVAFHGAVNTIDTATTFLNTNGVIFGNVPAVDPIRLTTTGDSVQIDGPVTLNTDTRIETAGGDVTFTTLATINSLADGEKGLTLDAGVGSVQFQADVGTQAANMRLGYLVVEEADAGVAFDQVAAVNVTDREPNTIDIGSTNAITGGIVLDGGAGTIALSSTDGNVRFNGPVRLHSNTRIDTASGPGNVLFTNQSTVDSKALENHDLTLAAGTGDVDFETNVGSNDRLRDLRIDSADNVTADAAINATTFVQQAGTGTTTFSGPVDTVGSPLGVSVTTLNVTVDSSVTTHGGSVDVDAGDAITMHNGALIAAGNGTIALKAVNDVTLAGVKTENATGNAVRIESTSGSVIDGGDLHVEVEADSIGATVNIDAATGVGSTDPLETKIHELWVNNSTSGAVEIAEENDLSIAGISNVHIIGADQGLINIEAKGTISIKNGTALESGTGWVTHAPIALNVTNNPFGQFLSWADTVQNLAGWFGNAGDGGRNFSLTIEWDDGRSQTVLGINHGDLVNLHADIAGHDGSPPWINPGGSTLPEQVTLDLSRIYSSIYLSLLSPPVAEALVTVYNDPNIRLEDNRGPDYLNQASEIVPTPVATMSLAGKMPEAFERPVPIPPQEIAQPPLFLTTSRLTRYEEISFRGEARQQQVRKLYIVKVVNGEEVDRTDLPLEWVSKMSELLTQFKDRGLPNGTYRIYLKEPNLPQRELMEFIKSEDTIGEAVREPGRGSNPILPDERGSDVPEPEEKPDAPPAAPQPSAEMPSAEKPSAEISEDPQPENVSASSRGASRSALGAALLAGTVLAADSTRGRWGKALDRAMARSAERPLTKVERMCRRLRQ